MKDMVMMLDTLGYLRTVTRKAVEQALKDLNSVEAPKHLARMQHRRDSSEGVFISGYAQKSYKKGAGGVGDFTVIGDEKSGGDGYTYTTLEELYKNWKIVE